MYCRTFSRGWNCSCIVEHSAGAEIAHILSNIQPGLKLLMYCLTFSRGWNCSCIVEHSAGAEIAHILSNIQPGLKLLMYCQTFSPGWNCSCIVEHSAGAEIAHVLSNIEPRLKLFHVIIFYAQPSHSYACTSESTPFFFSLGKAFHYIPSNIELNWDNPLNGVQL